MVGIRLWHVDARLYTMNNKFTTNVNNSSPFYTAFNNTYKTEEEDEHGRNSFSYSLSGNDDYQRFNMLHLIRKDTSKNFTSKTETLSVSLGFGESSEQTRTVSVSDLIITGGNPTPMDGEFALDSNELQAALSERKARLATMKEKDSTKATQKPAANKFKDLGF